MTRVINTPWGSAEITGKAGQVHTAFMEAVLFHGEDWRDGKDGSFEVLVDPYLVRKSLGAGSAYSKNTLDNIVKDLLALVVDLRIPKLELRVMGHFLEEVEESPMKRRNPFDGGRCSRSMWRVRFTRHFRALMDRDLPLHYNPDPLARLDHGISQAIARHALTHRKSPRGGWKIDNLIKIVGAGETSQAMRHRRLEVKADAGRLAEIGVIVNEDRVFLARNTSKSVQQRPDTVQQGPDGVQQRPDSFSKGQGV